MATNKVLTPKVVLNINNNSLVASQTTGLVYGGIFRSNKGPISQNYQNQQQFLNLAGYEDPTYTKGLDSINDLLSKSTNVTALRIVRPYSIDKSLVYIVTGTVPFVATASYQQGSLVDFGGFDYTLSVQYIANTVTAGNELAWLSSNAVSGLVSIDGSILTGASGFTEVPLTSIPSTSTVYPYYSGMTLTAGMYLKDPSTVEGDSYSYVAYDNNLGWITPSVNDSNHPALGNLQDYSFKSTEAFIVASIAPGSHYNQYSVSITKGSIKGIYNLRVYDASLSVIESYSVSFDVNDTVSFVEDIVNNQSNLITIKSNYGLLASNGGVINEAFFSEVLPTAVAPLLFVNNSTNQFVGYSTCTDSVGNTYVVGGFSQSSTSPDFLNGLVTANSFNETVYRYNVNTNSWMSLSNSNLSFGANMTFAQIGAVSVFVPSLNSILFFSTNSTGTAVQVFEYSLSTYSWKNTGVVQDSTLTNTPFDPSSIGTGILTDIPSAVVINNLIVLSVFEPGVMSYLLVYNPANNSFNSPVSLSAALSPISSSVRAPELIADGQNLLITQPSSGNIFSLSLTSSLTSANLSASPVVSIPNISLENAIYNLDSNSNTLSILATNSSQTSNEYREVNLTDGNIFAATNYSLLTDMAVGSSYPVNSIVLDSVSGQAYILKQPYVAGTLLTANDLSGFLSISSNANPVSALSGDYLQTIPYTFGSVSTGSFTPSKSGQASVYSGYMVSFGGTFNTKVFYGVFRFISSDGGKFKLSLGRDLALSSVSDLDVINTVNEFLNVDLYPQLDVLVDSGFNSMPQSLAIANVATSRKDTHAILSVPEAYQYSEASLVSYKEMMNLDTQYASLYAPGQYVRINNFTGKESLVNISGAVATLAIKNDNANGPWQVMAGPNNGLIDIALKLPPKDKGTPLALNYKQISYSDTDLLAANKINFIGAYNRSFPGIYLKSNLTLHTGNDELVKTHISRTTSYIASQCAALAVGFLYYPNNEQQRLVIQTFFNNLMKSIASNPVSLDSYKVVCNSSNNTDEMIDNGILNLDISFVVTNVIEEIVLNVSVDSLSSTVSVNQV